MRSGTSQLLETLTMKSPQDTLSDSNWLSIIYDVGQTMQGIRKMCNVKPLSWTVLSTTSPMGLRAIRRPGYITGSSPDSHSDRNDLRLHHYCHPGRQSSHLPWHLAFLRFDFPQRRSPHRQHRRLHDFNVGDCSLRRMGHITRSTHH